MCIKKIIAVMMSAVMAFVLSVSSYAYVEYHDSDITPMYEIAINPTAYITISGTSAICESSVSGLSTKVSSITVVQTLQKHLAFGIYTDVSGASWTKSVDGRNISISKSKSGLDSGTYRVKAVFTLTANDGTVETVTVYSETGII